MGALENLMRWAESEGIELNGIWPQRIPSRGIGVVATRAIKEGEVLLEVPTSALRTIKTVPKSITRKMPKDATVHCLLATDLVLETVRTITTTKTTHDRYGPWNAIMPSRRSLADAMPLAWPAALQALLPPAARALLRTQQDKFRRDWAMVSAAFPSSGDADDDGGLTEAAFLHAWLLVNTRTFYHTTPATEAARVPRDDRMALQPVADLFNHDASSSSSSDADAARSVSGTGAGCNVAYDAAGFTATATRPHAAGDEVRVCYGRHSNDALLAEYGFVLPGLGAASANGWDEALLDDAVLPRLSPRQRGHLEAAGFLGGYVLDARDVCHRTQVALRLLVVPLRRWRRFVEEGEGGADGGWEEEEAAQRRVDEILLAVLREYRSMVEGTLAELGKLRVGSQSQREVLRTRWEQILALIDAAIERLEP